MNSNLAKYFEDAAKRIKTEGTSKPGNDDLLLLYSNYKQATEGDCNIAQPSFYQLEAKAKYNAWMAKKGVSKEQAAHDYVVTAMKYLPESVTSTYN